MLGKPKFDYNDIVKFKIRMSEDTQAVEVEGSVAIIDRYGTFEQNKEVSYDIYNVKDNILYKHITEPNLTYVRKGTYEESLDYLYDKNSMKNDKRTNPGVDIDE